MPYPQEAAQLQLGLLDESSDVDDPSLESEPSGETGVDIDEDDSMPGGV